VVIHGFQWKGDWFGEIIKIVREDL